MSEPYVGEIRMGGWNFAPNGWMFCDGSLLSISEYEVLFTLIGTTYGGDGQNTFALPDLRGRVPVHQGTGFGQTVVIGQSGGTETVSLGLNQIPSHNHLIAAQSGAGDQPGPGGNMLANSGLEQYSTAATSSQIATGTIGSAGGSQPHDNLPPYLAISFVISLFGVFPSQN
jgi:microcystin-dependent protein